MRCSTNISKLVWLSFFTDMSGAHYKYCVGVTTYIIMNWLIKQHFTQFIDEIIIEVVYLKLSYTHKPIMFGVINARKAIIKLSSDVYLVAVSKNKILSRFGYRWEIFSTIINFINSKKGLTKIFFYCHRRGSKISSRIYFNHLIGLDFYMCLLFTLARRLF
jgi:hypothetical protein